MNKIDLNKIRNIGIAAHIDAGKTTITERILYYTGSIHKMGEVHQGTTTTDHMDQERERGITITSAAITASWKEHRLNLIDTPGHVDFTAEVERSLRVLDGAVAVFDAVNGVEPQSQTVWLQANKYSVPRICFINKMDKTGADLTTAIKSIEDKLNATVLQLQLPYFDIVFKGVIDVLTEKLLIWQDDAGSKCDMLDLTSEQLQEVKKTKEHLINTLTLHDEELLGIMCEREPTIEELKASIRRLTITQKAFPILCGSAFKKKGVQPLLDAVVDYLPSPADLKEVKGLNVKDESPLTREVSDKAPLSALVFKIVNDKYMGQLAFVRVYSGILKSSGWAYNSSTKKAEKIGRIVRMFADKQEDIDEVRTGNIAAVIGLNNCSTGDTLCDPDNLILLESMKFPDPVVSVSIEPKENNDDTKLTNALSRLVAEDPTLRVSTDDETGQTVMKGMGELHLEVIAERIKREFGVEVKTGKPQVAYRETITKTIEEVYLHKKQSGGKGQFAKVYLRVEPLPAGSGFEFVDDVVGGSIPKVYIKAVQAGVRETLERGVLADFPLIDLKATVFDGEYHDVDSSDMAFHIAAARAMSEACKRAGPTLLEPIMLVEISTPNEYVGDVIGDVSRRRGKINKMDQIGKTHFVNASIPLNELFGHTGDLRSLTSGMANPSPATLQCYSEAPKSVIEEIVGDKSEKN